MHIKTKMDFLPVIFVAVGALVVAMIYVVMGSKIRSWMHKAPTNVK